MNIDSREDFVNTWLFESPEGTLPTDYSKTVESNIRDVIEALKENPGFGKIVNINSSLRKAELTNTVYYWYEDKLGNILLGIELSKKPQGLVVSLVGKYNKGSPPYASDLYDAILQDRKSMGNSTAIRILSDKFLSVEGRGIWERLLNQGHKLMVYDANNPGQSHIKISTIDELRSYFKISDPAYKRYQYILSESSYYPDIIAFFNTRRMRELSGIL